MRFIGTSKIGWLTAKKGKIYPQIRLSPRLADIIGEAADVFETDRNGSELSCLSLSKMCYVITRFYNAVRKL